MITLYASAPGFELPEISPYAMKAEVQLQMAELPYVKTPALPHQSPKGQLPFIEDDGVMIADSTFIRAHLETKYGIDLDEGLTEAQRAQAWAIERMLENQFGWIMTRFRFLEPANFAKGPAHWFDHAPEDVREALRAGLLDRVSANLMAVGILRHSRDEIVMLGQKTLSALSALLGGKPYLMGNQPTGVDAFAFAILSSAMTPFFDSPVQARALSHANLVDYVARMMARYYPGHAWNPAPMAARAA